MNPSENRRVGDQVLAMIAERQRENHQANQSVQKATLEIVTEMRDELGQMRIDFALVSRDVTELKEWRKVTIDPFVNATRDYGAQVRGGSRVLGWVWAVICAGGLGLIGWVVKIAAAVLVAAKP